MANHLGKEGYLRISATTVAEFRGYTLSTSADNAEDTVIGDDWKTHRTTLKSWQVSGDLFWDETDAGQVAITLGAAVTVALYPEGVASSATYFTGQALVTGFDITARHDSLVEASFSGTGNGTLTTTTV